MERDGEGRRAGGRTACRIREIGVMQGKEANPGKEEERQKRAGTIEHEQRNPRDNSAEKSDQP